MSNPWPRATDRSMRNKMKKTVRAATALIVAMFVILVGANNVRAQAPADDTDGRMAVVIVGESDNLADEASAATEVAIAAVGSARSEPGFRLNAPLPTVMVGSEEVMATLAARDQRMVTCVSEVACLAQACKVHGVTWALVGTVVHRGDDPGEFIINLSLFDASAEVFVLSRPFRVREWNDMLRAIPGYVRDLLQQQVVGQREVTKALPSPDEHPPEPTETSPLAVVSPPPVTFLWRYNFNYDFGLGAGVGFGELTIGVDYEFTPNWRARLAVGGHKTFWVRQEPWPMAEVFLTAGAERQFGRQFVGGVNLGVDYLFAQVGGGVAGLATLEGGVHISGWTVGLAPTLVLGDYTFIRAALVVRRGFGKEVSR